VKILRDLSSFPAPTVTLKSRFIAGLGVPVVSRTAQPHTAAQRRPQMSSVRISHIHARSRLFLIGGLMWVGVLLVAGCTQQRAPMTPASLTTSVQLVHVAHHGATGSLVSHGMAADKGYIDGWFNGETVQLHYTKAFFCDQPPSSGATTECEIGAAPQVAPRPGPIPTIYAIAAVGGIQPDPSTLACLPGSPCLNHPAMIDVSRLRGPGFENSPGLPHSHILAEHHAGWFNTVNILQHCEHSRLGSRCLESDRRGQES
jgi:hypothetical protein